MMKRRNKSPLRLQRTKNFVCIIHFSFLHFWFCHFENRYDHFSPCFAFSKKVKKIFRWWNQSARGHYMKKKDRSHFTFMIGVTHFQFLWNAWLLYLQCFQAGGPALCAVQRLVIPSKFFFKFFMFWKNYQVELKKLLF